VTVIQINLLPPEYRPRQGTPVARFVAIVAGVVVVACAGGAYAYTHFVELAKVKEMRGSREEEVKSKESQRDRSLALAKEIDVYAKRRAAIQTINRSRTLWSRKLDQFFDIVTSQAQQDAYIAWLEGLEVPPQAQATRRRSGIAKKKVEEDGGSFRFVGNLAMGATTDAPALSSEFYKALTGDPDSTGHRTDFYADFIRINNPNIVIEDRASGLRDVELTPPVVGSFRYELALRAPAPPPGAAPSKPARAARGASR
jgi:cell division protein FtsB